MAADPQQRLKNKFDYGIDCIRRELQRLRDIENSNNSKQDTEIMLQHYQVLALDIQDAIDRLNSR